jgi:ribonuclease Z
MARNLRVIHISHPHADHHLGLVRILAERNRLLKTDCTVQKILVIAPPSVLAFLRDYSTIDSSVLDSYYPLSCRLIDKSDRCTKSDEFWIEDECEDISEWGSGQSRSTDTRRKNYRLTNESIELMNFASKILESMGISEIVNVPVHHCPQSYGLSILWKNGLKLVYSGDTRPCKQLVELGLGATILIHEATFDDENSDAALSKRHSTVREALNVCKEMGAQSLILTHFSQRYQSCMPIPEDSIKPIIAFDFMKIKFSDISWVQEITKLLPKIFPDSADELDLELSGNDTFNQSCRCPTHKSMVENLLCLSCSTVSIEQHSTGGQKRKRK